MTQLIDPCLAPLFDKLPPHSIEAEMTLLCSLLMSDKIMIARVRRIITRDSFYQADHQIIYDAICRVADAGKTVDVRLVVESIKSAQLWEEIGGREYFAAICASYFTAAHAEYYAQVVRGKELWRGLIALSNDSLRTAYGPCEGTIEEAISSLNDFASKASRMAAGGKGSEVQRLGDLLHEVSRDRTADDVAEFIETGIASLDELIGGLWIGMKMLIGARTGIGKSTLMRQFAINLALRRVRVGIISIEETGRKIARNVLANQAGIANSRIAKQQCDGNERHILKEVAADLKDAPVFVVDSARKLSSIVGMANLLATEHGCQVIMVDHLHIVDSEIQKNRSREQEIAKISAELKWTWKQLNVAGVEVAQLNRGTEASRPSLQSLRDSGTLEQDADVIMLLHREDYYKRGQPGYVEDHVLEIDVAKNKDNPVGIIPLHYDRARHRISEAPKEETQYAMHRDNPFD